jgi:hypothetical protein
VGARAGCSTEGEYCWGGGPAVHDACPDDDDGGIGELEERRFMDANAVSRPDVGGRAGAGGGCGLLANAGGELGVKDRRF